VGEIQEIMDAERPWDPKDSPVESWVGSHDREVFLNYVEGCLIGHSGWSRDMADAWIKGLEEGRWPTPEVGA
jgi:hypothetical protein